MKRKFDKKFDKLTDDYREGDGKDPRYDKKESRGPHNRKAMQLCSQVQRALAFEFQLSSCEEIRDMYVESVTPAPDSLHLLVTVVIPEDLEPKDAYTVLEGSNKLFRIAVSQAINRKKTPELKFTLKR